MTVKKTVKILDVVAKANSILLNSPDDYKEGRAAIAQFLENILLDADQYDGFKYLSEDDMIYSEQGTPESVGIRLNETTNPQEQFANTDHTRVHYFFKS